MRVAAQQHHVLVFPLCDHVLLNAMDAATTEHDLHDVVVDRRSCVVTNESESVCGAAALLLNLTPTFTDLPQRSQCGHTLIFLSFINNSSRENPHDTHLRASCRRRDTSGTGRTDTVCAASCRCDRIARPHTYTLSCFAQSA